MVGCKEQMFNGVLPSVDGSVGYNRISPENAFAGVAFASLNRQTDKESDLFGIPLTSNNVCLSII